MVPVVEMQLVVTGPETPRVTRYSNTQDKGGKIEALY